MLSGGNHVCFILLVHNGHQPSIIVIVRHKYQFMNMTDNFNTKYARCYGVAVRRGA